MTEKQLTKRMEALTNLAKYSTEITLRIPTEFLVEEPGRLYPFTEKLIESINCLINDKKNEIQILRDYWNHEQTVIVIRAIDIGNNFEGDVEDE